MKEYKLWVEIEEYDDETEEYQDVGEPVDIGIFETFDDAQAFLDSLELSFTGRCMRTGRGIPR